MTEKEKQLRELFERYQRKEADQATIILFIVAYMLTLGALISLGFYLFNLIF